MFQEVPVLQFVPSKRGGKILIYKNNSYVQTSSKIRWYCSKKFQTPFLQFMPSKRGGTIMIYNNNTYVQMNSKLRWYCSKKAGGCKSRVVVTEDGEFVTELGGHNH
ncbi:hypothetical protein PYW08_016033 [Mythimna loreyi]|uniref:Uncharacterized protein n=1 Tax=Mythimna loreyi TaxID=667449 RepID=A0ACC2QUB6_9NEOP|nr:hypothetical protein PYW08_016033 [Mythimna loreyi]